MGNYGIKVALSKKDVINIDDTQLAFTSKAFGLKILLTGTIDITIPGTANLFDEFSGTVTHRLGYAPAFFVYVSDTNGNFYGINMPFVPDMDNVNVYGYSDFEVLTLILGYGGGTKPTTRTLRYYIFAEPIS